MKIKYWVLLAVAISVLVLDQWTKHTVRSTLPLHEKIEVIPGFFNLTHVRNPGGAFGVFGGVRGGVVPVLFIFVSILAIGIILVILFRARRNEKTVPIALSLVLGGATGNLIDRIRFGDVTDFLDFHVSTYHWPAFNVADAVICLGVGLMIFGLWLQDHGRSTARK